MSYVRKIYTLVFIKNNDEILLGLKARGLGAGMWNGFGGKVENETVWHAAKRELKEESNLECAQLQRIGIVYYEEEAKPEIAVVHVFTGYNYTGDLKSTEEMNPVKWFKFTEIPFGKMWPDAPLWYPLMLKNKYFTVTVRYDAHGTMQKKQVCVWNSLQSVLINDQNFCGGV